MFEHPHEPLLSRALFRHRMFRRLLIGTGILLVALGIGVLGYRALAEESWTDAFLDASMILSGMGPVSVLTTPGAKIFAGCYALFSGLSFTALLGYVFAPLVHRFLHRFHHNHHQTPETRT